MAFECNHCDRRFISEDSLDQHTSSKHAGVKAKKRGFGFRKYIIISLVFLIIISSSFMIYSSSQGPGEYDDFTKCLTDKGAIIYGNDYCQYTAKQLNYFGKSEKYLDYVKCIEDQALCDSKGVDITPTWEIDGKMYESVQTFERLSSLTGCEI